MPMPIQSQRQSATTTDGPDIDLAAQHLPGIDDMRRLAALESPAGGAWRRWR